MIHGPTFYRNFDAGFAEAAPPSAVTRAKGAPSRYVAETPAGPVHFWFRVNSKASAIPNHPGEFWPVISDADDATVSWYQRASAEQVAAILELQKRVYDKVAAQEDFAAEVYREMRDAGLPLLLHHARTIPEPRLPHHALLYLDAGDAQAWGRLLGGAIEAWLEAFAANPETVDSYMWRVHWSE
ncbi:hypothetical protein BH23GEM11_BH23GEM11_04260 [soil metagenome]